MRAAFSHSGRLVKSILAMDEICGQHGLNSSVILPTVPPAIRARSVGCLLLLPAPLLPGVFGPLAALLLGPLSVPDFLPAFWMGGELFRLCRQRRGSDRILFTEHGPP